MDAADPISFLGARCPVSCRLRTLILQPGDALDYRRADWVDALVVVERGGVELECRSGARAWFGEGAVLLFTGLGLRRIRNASTSPLVLSVLSRVQDES